MPTADPNTTTTNLDHHRASIFLILWYFFSGCTLFLNKYIMSELDGDPTLLGTAQMSMTLVCGFVQMYVPCGFQTSGTSGGGGVVGKGWKRKRPPGFVRHMVLVGTMRFSTVVLGLIALNYVAVSFTETIKSSAPIFTVLISYLILKERTGLYTNVSLLPVMIGLCICSWNEVSFDARGFLAALATNCTECLQNVYSKMLISGERYKYSPAELQFYTSISSMIVQIPVTLFLVNLQQLNSTLVSLCLVNGLFFHFQSISAYVLMDFISPVTHSVVNTVKRAFLIWCSVLLFNNQVTFLSALGTCIIFIGVLCYNQARRLDQGREVIVIEPKYYEKLVEMA